MKKITAIVICAIMMLAAAVPAFAGQNDDVFKTATIDWLADLDSFDENSGFQMRGFAVSPDGKYVYGGFLQNYRHVSKIDATTGEHLAEYAPEIENDEYDGVVANNNYPKGIAVDCRGYLFVGITHDVPNTSYISIACVDPANIDEDGYMKEIATITEDMSTDRVGINGVATQKIGDKVLLYVVTCYNKDTLRCYDVTDVSDIKLYNGFGNGGVVDYNELTGSQSDPGYLTVDVDGYIYLCYKADNSAFDKGSHVMKIDKDGKSMIDQVEVREAYGICTAGDYLFVSTYDGVKSKIVVLNKSDLSSVAELAYADQFSSLSGCGYGGNCLYIGDHGDGTSAQPGIILKSSELNITRDPRETETMERQAVETKAETTAEAGPVEQDGKLILLDFTDPEVVSKIGNGNSVKIEYDEVEGCLKVTVTGEDPYFTLPMKKETYFDGDKYNTLVINYKTSVEDSNGEIFFTTKESRELAANHITYFMEAAAEYTDFEIDMREDDNGNWGSQIRSLRLDPTTEYLEDEEQVFYIKSVAVKEGEEIEETEPETTKAPDTEAQTTDTEKTDDTTKAADDTTKSTETTKNNNNNNAQQSGGFNPLFVIIPVAAVIVIGVVVFIIIKAKKKK